ERAVAFLLKQMAEIPVWLGEAVQGNLQIIVPATNGVRRITPVASYAERLFRKIFQVDLLNNGKLAYLQDNQLRNGPEAYGPEDLLHDLRTGLFEQMKDAPVYYRQLAQSLYVDRLIAMSGALKSAGGAGSFAEDTASGLISHRDLHEGCCFQVEHGPPFSLSRAEDLYFPVQDMPVRAK